MTPPRRLYTLRQAAVEVLGWADTRASLLRLKRLVKARERASGKMILTRDGGGTAPYMITEARLRDHLPEFFSKRNEMAKLVRKELEQVNEKLRELKLRDNALAANIRELRGEVKTLESSIHQRSCVPS